MYDIEFKKSGQLCNALLYRTLLILMLKFESNERYHCIRKTTLNGDDLSAYHTYFLLSDEKSVYVLIEVNFPGMFSMRRMLKNINIININTKLFYHQ